MSEDINHLRRRFLSTAAMAITDVVGPAMEKNDCRTIGGAGFGVSNVKQTGVDLLH
jgi:hypothetical protein